MYLRRTARYCLHHKVADLCRDDEITVLPVTIRTAMFEQEGSMYTAWILSFEIRLLIINIQ